jgi:D-alanyl-lipoteichoic acid acyltransferase DltB (MBOAT superfamily)
MVADSKFGCEHRDTLYVMFYPQLVAGPIERPQNMLHQFYEKHFFDYQRVVEGLRMMLWGMFKKVVIADRLSIFVDMVYSHPNEYHGFQTILACIFFSFQIFCDFSGYSDIALGSAKVMGFDLMVNFNYPFRSKNITEFWRRWHISLSTWFNDYLFTPMLVSTRDWGKYAVVFSLFVTFTLSGVWHGAGLTFIIYGIIHGAAVVYEVLSKKFRKKLSKQIPKIIYNGTSVVLTFCFVTMALIFFRSPDFSTAMIIIKNSVHISKSQLGLYMLGPDNYNFILSFVLIALMESIHWLLGEEDVNTLLNKQHIILRWVVYVLFLLFIINLGETGKKEFIYFQF